MSTHLLGVDTGGTYTDAVVVDADQRVVASAKSLTTRHDLSIGVAGAIDAALAAAGVDPADIGLVSLSTTLATNAIVEGRTGRIALVRMGLDEEGCRRAGLPDALGGDPELVLTGGHDSAGRALGEPDLGELDRLVAGIEGDVEGFAVAAQFSVRNPAHETLVRDHLLATTGRPVTCGHELSSSLNGPARAVTCVLNARLIGLIDGLLDAASRHLDHVGVDAPLVVVRGDGSLMSVEVARARPVETVLSGPAASVVGAMHLAGDSASSGVALVSDIGGTTTDVAIVRDGQPALAPDGARVGGHRTMVGAVAVTTVGLGGDSAVSVDPEVGRSRLVLGPRRVVPLSLLAVEHRDAVMSGLADDARMELPSPVTGRFVWRIGDAAGLDDREQRILDSLTDSPSTWRSVVMDRRAETAMQRLIARGVVGTAGVTPTDAAHVLGLHDAFDAETAHAGLALMTRHRDRFGNDLDDNAESLAHRIVDTLVEHTASTLFGVALGEHGIDPSSVRYPLIAAAMQPGGMASDLVRAEIALKAPVIGLGASAATYYPAVADAVSGVLVCPEHAEVANAVGAVAGRIRVVLEAMVDEPAPDRFRVSGAVEPTVHDDVDAAIEAARESLAMTVRRQALARGAAEVDVAIVEESNVVDLNGNEYFVSHKLTATGTGRPATGIAR